MSHQPITWTWSSQHRDSFTQVWNGQTHVYVWGRQVMDTRQYPQYQTLWPSLSQHLQQMQQVQQQVQPPVQHQAYQQAPQYAQQLAQQPAYQQVLQQAQQHQQQQQTLQQAHHGQALQQPWQGQREAETGAEDEDEEDEEDDEEEGKESGQQRHDSLLLTQPMQVSSQTLHDAQSVLSDLPEDTLRGNPRRGSFVALDPAYRVQNNAWNFFRQGRMFAVLFSEPLGETAPPNMRSDHVTVVLYGGKVYTDIRRFIVVQEKRGFCYACPVSTYGDRGTLKPGVDVNSHAIVYCTNSRPVRLQGEPQLTKSPIGVVPADESVTLKPASRINFGIYHPIQHNVKVKDLGRVRPEDMSNLISYWRTESNIGGFGR